jgi:dihydropteroate synthase
MFVPSFHPSLLPSGSATAAILGGAHLLRVHDVREMRAVADVADEILRQAPGQ